MSDAAKFNVGDRVRDNFGRIGIVATIYDRMHIVAYSPPLDDGLFCTEIDSADLLTLVEVAHYAPPGVPMIAMAPERIELLTDATGETSDGTDGIPWWLHDVLVAILAEARGASA